MDLLDQLAPCRDRRPKKLKQSRPYQFFPDGMAYEKFYPQARKGKHHPITVIHSLDESVIPSRGKGPDARVFGCSQDEKAEEYLLPLINYVLKRFEGKGFIKIEDVFHPDRHVWAEWQSTRHVGQKTVSEVFHNLQSRVEAYHNQHSAIYRPQDGNLFRSEQGSPGQLYEMMQRIRPGHFLFIAADMKSLEPGLVGAAAVELRAFNDLGKELAGEQLRTALLKAGVRFEKVEEKPHSMAMPDLSFFNTEPKQHLQ